MPHQVLKSVISLLLLWHACFASGTERFIVTDRRPSEFIVEYLAHSADFVVTDREPPDIKPTHKPAVTPRPIVLLYSAKWCAPCRAARQALDKAALPFEIRVVDVTEGGQPAYVDGIPYFEWQTRRGRWFGKWTTVEDLVKRWELTH